MAKSNKDYDPHSIEKKWRKKWEESKIYQPDLDKARKPFYNLMMFPYPSAEGLHVGSVFTFTGVDTYGRFKRMQGFDVFEPMGLDGFGIHSENYALQVGRHPQEQARVSESNFYRQLKSIGNGFDWSRKVETYDPNYYKWTQWIFIQLFKRGLAYRKKAPVNFCPSCKTVLADEQVINGGCERCSSIVEKRELEQWFFKITDYADRLLNNIPKLNWTEKVKIAQEQWIGKKEGINIKYQVSGSNYQVVCWTSRPDTNFGATFIVVGPEHYLIEKLLSEKISLTRTLLARLEGYVTKAKKKTEEERIAEGKKKTGVFTGLYAINNLNGMRLPIWVSDFVLGNVGTGAVVGVPGHDIRDFEFAKEFYLPIIRVVVGKDGDTSEIKNLSQVQEEEGTMINSEFLNGLDIHEATQKIMDYLEEKGWGKRVTTYHLRDWLISRQRYWGPPIPMIHCKKCGWQPVPEKDLPVVLPDVKDWRPNTSTSLSVKGPLANHPEFYETKCPNCEGPAERETDVSDTFLDSSWYFFRYISTEFDGEPFDKLRARKWLPVSIYIGGAEHSVLHLFYSRFTTMVFKDMGLCDFEEPYSQFYAHGLIIKEGRKMSKSRGNVVNPDHYLAKYGADTLRAYLRFVGPFDMGGNFRDSGIESMHRFLTRIFTFVTTKQFIDKTPIDLYLEKLIQEITEELQNLRFNTAFARLMMYYNFLVRKDRATGHVFKEEILVFIKLLAPFTPFLAEELWQSLGQKFSVHLAPWPSYDEKRIKADYGVTMAVQINGKTRATFDIKDVNTAQKEVESIAKRLDNVHRHLEGKEIKKTIFVPGKIINFVTLS